MKLKLSGLLLVSGLLFFFGCDQQSKNTQMSQSSGDPMSQSSGEAMNPCDMKMLNPCSTAGKGRALWMDASLGTSGKTCNTCHFGGTVLLKLDKPFPHRVGMVGKVVTLKEMINYCITHPLEGTAIDENGAKMEEMVAFYNHLVAHPPTSNPCHMGKMKNPCHMNSMKNPCHMSKMKNPCHMKKMKNPCHTKKSW